MSDLGQLEYRVGEIERARERERAIIERLDDAVTRHDEQISGAGGLVKAMEQLGMKVDGLQKALWAFAASFLIAALTIAVTVSQVH